MSRLTRTPGTQDQLATKSNGLRLSIGAEAGAALVIAVGLFGLIAGVLGVTRHPVTVAILALVSAAAVVGAARRGADLYAVPLALAAVLAFDFFYLPPYRRFGFPDYANWGALALYFRRGRPGLRGQPASRRSGRGRRPPARSS